VRHIGFLTFVDAPALIAVSVRRLTGVPISYVNWDQNEASNGGQSCVRQVVENCVDFKFGNGNFRWHDSGCTPSGQSTPFGPQPITLPPIPA
jgi:hypothetical protein